MDDSVTADAGADIHAPDFLADPDTAFGFLRREAPVAYCPAHGGYWLLTRAEDVRAAALDWRTYTSAVVGVTAIPAITPRTRPQLPIELDPPLHSRYRQLINPAFAPARIEAMVPGIRALTNERLSAGALAGCIEAVSDLCVPVALASLAALTDLPVDDAPLWVEWITALFSLSDRPRAAEAAEAMGAYIRDLIEARRAAPLDDFVSLLCAAEIEGERLSDDDIHSFLTVLFGAGFETTADGLSVMLHWLARHAEAQERLAGRPELRATAVEEFLRIASPVQVFGRNATRDVTLHGRRIPAGAVVALAFGAANRDPSVFEAPDEVRLDRQPNRHLAFGAGPHLCAGAPVARMEMRVVLDALATGGLRLSPNPNSASSWKGRGDRRGLSRLPLLVLQGPRP